MSLGYSCCGSILTNRHDPECPTGLGRKAVLVDMDHTMSDARPRDGMIGVASWDEYHAAASEDAPLHDIVNLINVLHESGRLIVMVTVRPAKFRELTMRQLVSFRANVDEILMRPDENFRPSVELKVELALARFPDIRNEVAFILEDREDVCAAFVALGITALQVHGRRE